MSPNKPLSGYAYITDKRPAIFPEVQITLAEQLQMKLSNALITKLSQKNGGRRCPAAFWPPCLAATTKASGSKAVLRATGKYTQKMGYTTKAASREDWPTA